MEWIKSYKSREQQDTVVQDFNLEGLEQMLDLLEKATGRNIPVSQERATELFANQLGLYKMTRTKSVGFDRSQANSVTVTTSSNVAQINKLVELVYNYWIQKRSKLKKPLLRIFWPLTAPDDSSPHLVFRPREKERYKLRKKVELLFISV